MELPTPLNCLIIQHVIDDRDTIEHYLAIDPEMVEKCLPIALRGMLNDYAIPTGLVPMTTPDAEELKRYLEALWNDDPEYTSLLSFDSYYIYILPYLLIRHPELIPVRYDEINDLMDNVIDNALDGDAEALKLLVMPKHELWKAVPVTGHMLRYAINGESYINSEHHYIHNTKDVLNTVNILLSVHPDKRLVDHALGGAIDFVSEISFAQTISPFIIDRINRYLQS